MTARPATPQRWPLRAGQHPRPLSCVSSKIVPRIARPGIESSERLGRHRWVIERTLAWLSGYRRLTVRYERHGRLFAAFLTLAATLTCYKKLAKTAT
jgi:transposase